MSYQEIDRVGVIELVESKKLSQIEESKQLNISSRQIRRLQQCCRKEDVTGLLSKRRGNPSNNQLPEAIKPKSVG